MKNKVYVTGFGIVTGIGCGEDETFTALQQKRSAIGKISFLETALKNYPVAELKKTNEDLVCLASLPEDKMYSRTFLLGINAAQQAMQMAGLKTSQGLVAATTVGGIDLRERYYKELADKNNIRLRRKINPWLDFAICTEKIAEHFFIRSNVTTIVQPVRRQLTPSYMLRGCSAAAWPTVCLQAAWMQFHVFHSTDSTRWKFCRPPVAGLSTGIATA